MRKHGNWIPLAACLAMLVLILDSKTAITEAKAGMAFLITTVIPSLFPFFFLSILLSASAEPGQFVLLRFLGNLAGLPREADDVLIPAFLGGYPAGAQAVSNLWKQNRISKNTAEHLLAFCNNAGPSFLFGILSPLFPKPWMVWVLWGFHIAGALFASRILCGSRYETAAPSSFLTLSLPQVLTASIYAMSSVCGWLLLFRILIGFLNRWLLWLIPLPLQALVAGLLELTNGCLLLFRVEDIRLRFLLCSGLLALGGVCISLQTASVTRGLSLRFYCLGKLIQALFSICVSAALVFQNLLFLLPVFLTYGYSMLRRKKEVAFPRSMVYNVFHRKGGTIHAFSKENSTFL